MKTGMSGESKNKSKELFGTKRVFKMTGKESKLEKKRAKVNKND